MLSPEINQDITEQTPHLSELMPGHQYEVDTFYGSHDNLVPPDGSHDSFVEPGEFEDWFYSTVNDEESRARNLRSRKIVHLAEAILSEAMPEVVNEVIESEETAVILQAESVVNSVFENICEDASKLGRTIEPHTIQKESPILQRVAEVSRSQVEANQTYNT